MTDLEMVITCRRCGDEHQPTHADFVAGRWRLCRRCRDGPDAPDDHERPERSDDRPTEADTRGQTP